MILLWTGFFICTGLIIYAGSKLSRYGDIIAEKTGLGRAWIGMVLIASVTSLPELVTGISAVTFAGVPNIAIGDVLGSCVFNMLIISFLDANYRVMPISTKAHQGNILAAAFGILLTGIVSLSIYMGKEVAPLGWIGPYSIVIIIIYLVAMRLVYQYEKRLIAEALKEKAAELKYEDISTRDAVIKYSINAVIVIVAATFLPAIGEGIAEQTGLGQTFVGNIFIAIATSLPEVVVSLSAIKIDAIDLAIGNLFGSNIFNIFILAIDDIFFTQGPLLSFASPDHIISAQSAIIMMTIAVIGLTYRATKKTLFLAWDTIMIVMVYITNIMLLYVMR